MKITALEKEFLKFIEQNKPKTDEGYCDLVSSLTFSLAIIAFEKSRDKGLAYFLMLEDINKAYGHMLREEHE